MQNKFEIHVQVNQLEMRIDLLRTTIAHHEEVVAALRKRLAELEREAGNHEPTA